MAETSWSKGGRGERAIAFWAVVLALETLAFGFLNLDYGHHPSDDGWLLAYGWRIVHGQVPYRDFFWAQTPLSLYLASLWLHLPDGVAFKAGRWFFYFEMWAIAAMPLAFAASAGLVKRNVLSASVVVIAFGVALHNFPAMPWSTVDGLFFGSAALAAYLVSLTATRTPVRLASLAASSVLAVAAAACKQGFVFLPVALAAAAAVEGWRRRRRAAFAMAVLPGLLAVLAGVGWLRAHDAWTPFLQALRGSSQEGAFVRAGFEAYLRPLPVGPVVYGCFLVLGVLLGRSRRHRAPVPGLRRRSDQRGVLVSLVLVALAALAVLMNTPLGYRVAVGVFFLSAGVLLQGVLEAWRSRGTGSVQPSTEPSALALGAGTLSLGWCASISYGYQTPILAVGAMGVFLACALPPAPGRVPAWIAVVTVGVALVAVAVHQLQHPYRERPRAQQTADLGATYPRLGRLWTNPHDGARFAEMKAVVARFARGRGRPFVALPGFPLVYYLENVTNPTSIDWYVVPVIAGRDQRLLDELTASDAVAIVGKDLEGALFGETSPPCAQLHTSTAAIAAVLRSWRLVYEGPAFCVYDPPLP